ncbi:hypothetical protein [Paenibacillus pini]|uniref:Uncharacterized protein n=1 Tax=Paenibacillus pini JCM 16418 TaxID=1236976 RepID=W7Y6S8_9BACL|nr:hypothetical protein [Paenibacillus pini]GAF06620.1 hypothetical protein JCM16418_590 [Paenibacillus pini JCM 16418]
MRNDYIKQYIAQEGLDPYFIVHELFKSHPGRYAIGQLSNNMPAVQFWRNIYDSGNIDFYEKEELDEGLTLIYQFFKV